MKRVQPEVTVVGSRFKLGPHQYRVKGHPEVYNSRADALVERSGQHEPDELSSHYHRDEDEFWEDHRRGFNMPRSNRK